MYCKLFASLYQGTLRGRSDEILVFTNLLAHTSAGGMVDIHFRAVSEETGLSLDRVKQAILALESPDEESRSPEEQGARLVRLDEHRAWGWRVVNHGKYRAIKNEDDRAEQNRLAQARFRERKKAEANGETSSEVNSVSESNTSKPKQRHKAEAEADTEEKNTPAGDSLSLDSSPPVSKPRTSGKPSDMAELVAYSLSEGGNQSEAQDFFDKMEAKGWIVGKSKIKDWKAQFRTYHRNGWLNADSRPIASQTSTYVPPRAPEVTWEQHFWDMWDGTKEEGENAIRRRRESFSHFNINIDEQ